MSHNYYLVAAAVPPGSHTEGGAVFRFIHGDRPGNYRLVDESRRVTYRIVGGRVMSSAIGAVLSWDDREIPLEFDGEMRTDASTGKDYGLYYFTTFGSGWTASSKAGVGAFTFRDPQEEARARLLAVEAVLVDVFRFVKGDWKDEAARFNSEGREWRASDFGYRTSADITDSSQ